MRTVDYTTDAERTAAIAEAEAADETMLHDDFGTGKDGANLLTFETADEQADRQPAPTPEALRMAALSAKIADDTATLAGVREYLRGKDGLVENLDGREASVP